MKLSQILKSKSVLQDDENDGHGSWGIFVSPENPDYVVKLFHDERQFDDEKLGYDKVLGEISLRQLANQYKVISIQMDTYSFSYSRTDLPYKNAIMIPYLSSPKWKNVGKLGCKETDEKLEKIGLGVKEVKNNFLRLGIATWELTFFSNIISSDIKAIDFTYDRVVGENHVSNE